MSLAIITADQRISAPRGAKIALFGPPGAGKTWQLHTLPPERTLFVDFEAGDLSVQDVPVDTLRPKTWNECCDLAAFLGGGNPAFEPHMKYSENHFNSVSELMGGPDAIDRYDTYFVDSITVTARICFKWAQSQPEAFSEKTGKPDIRGAYGLLGREMIAWLSQIQQARGKNVIFVGILEKVVDDFNVAHWQAQIEGSKTGRELPGIVDEVITLNHVAFEDGKELVRTFVCLPNNPFGWPAKDRSGRLEMFEKPHLGELINKIILRDTK